MGDKKVVFKPIYGPSDLIEQSNKAEGQLFFETDTGKIYLDVDAQRRVLMGGSSSGASIYFSTQGESGEITPTEDGEYILYAADITADEDAKLSINDLIIAGDGAFYRIQGINENEDYVCSQIAISGGGGGPAVEPKLSIVIDSSTLDSNATLVQGKDYYVSVTGTAINGNPDRYVSLNFEFTGNNGYSESFTITGVQSGEPYRLNLNFLPVNSSIAMRVSVDSDNAQMSILPFTRKTGIKVVDMRIDKVAGSNYIPVQFNDLQLRYIPYGRGLNAQLHTAIDGEEFDNDVTLIDDNMENAQTVTIPKQIHGSHVVSLWLSATVNRVELSSDPVYYEASWVDELEEFPLIWTGNITPVVIQYEQALIPYMVYDITNERTGSATTVDFYKNGIQVSSESVRYSADGWLYWDVTTLYDVGENEFTISCGPASKQITFSVTTEGSRDLSLTQPSALVMNFDSMGRSSTEIATTRGVWKSKVRDYAATLNNFNWYNNGWKDDKNDLGSYLSIANGASVAIPFGTISMVTGSMQWTFEMRFRIRNAQKYATLVTEVPLYKYWLEVTERDETGRAIDGTLNTDGTEETIDWINDHNYEVKLDSDGNKEMNEANTTRKIVETDNNVVLKYLNNSQEGFCIGTQEAYFNTSGKTVNVRYKEGEIINISFVVDKQQTLSIYLNGILSGAVNLTGINVIVMENIPFLINSQYCDFDLYKFRIYNIALTMPEVIHNYLADIKSISLYDENQLTDVNDATKLSYNKLVEYNENHPDNLTMPYVLIDSSGTPADDELPHFKGGGKKVSISFVNPSADKLLADGNISESDYYSHCPSFTAESVDIDVQGTSSQKYPRRNFKVKFKKAKNWNYTQGSLSGQSVAEAHELPNGLTISKNWHADNFDLSTNKFTWKIDYMESSGSYNTGFANLMGSGVYNKHPLDDIGFDASAKHYRTSVYGFPFLAFHKRADGSITYIGRYNFNLDKGSNEYYGFEEKYAQPYLVNKASMIDPDTGDTVYYTPTVKEISECWELRDNQGTWCSFRYPTDEARELGFMAPTADSTVANPKIEVAQHFEARYNAEGDAFETAQKYKTIDDDGNDYSDVIGGTSNAAICAYLNKKMANLKVLFDWLDSTDTTHARPDYTFDEPIEMEVTARSDDPSVTYEERTVGGAPKLFGTFTKDTVEYRRQKFRNEFDKHLDRHYCTIYFIMTELLLCYDSRGKNMMIASFGPRENDGEFIWYPIFYDIDTQLGLNNVGAWLWDYDEDSTENRTFSTGDSVLWTNFADMFHNEIITTYRGLRQTKITYNTIEGAYTCNPDVFTNSYAMRGKRPIVAIGLDEYYKYVLPVTEPWKSQDGSYITANYLYACQGDRILSRELLINNRLLYMDSKWHSGDFTVEKTMTSVTFRVSGNDPINTSDKYLENPQHSEAQYEATYPVPYYDANPVYKVTPYLNFYITWFTDENSFPNPEPYDANKYPNGMDTIVSQDVLASFKSGVVDEQLNYFPGANYVSSFGDLSTKYLTQVSLPQGEKLLDITLGSDAPLYFNNKMKVTDFDLGTGVNSNQKALLQKIILSHLRNLDIFIDASNPQKLREFRALDTKIKYALFADGAPLSIVHLPKTVTRLKFIENKNLTKILTSAPTVADMVNNELVYRPENTYSGLYVEGLTDYDPLSDVVADSIAEIEFEGDAMGYDSYTILKNAVDIVENTDHRLRIRMDSVNWTPYKMVEYGEERQQNVDYFYATDHSTFEPYTRNTWDADTLNGKVYTFDSNAPKATIDSLDLLDMFKQDYEDGVDGGVINKYTNNNESMSDRPTVPTITGDIFIANAEGTPIAEDALTNVYGVLWPNLTIRAESVIESYIAKYVQILDSGKEDEIDVLRFSPIDYDDTRPDLTRKIPSKTNYTFLGWALDAAGTRMVYNYNRYTGQYEQGSAYDDEDFLFSLSNNVIVLYAIFESQRFGIKFYDGDGSLIVEDPNDPVYYIAGVGQRDQVTMLVPYGEHIPVLKKSPWKDDSALAIDRTYLLSGWATTVDGAATDISSKIVRGNLVYYPVFTEGDVHNNPLPQEFFSIRIVDEYTGTYAVIKIANGYSIRGKVTLPGTVTVGGTAYRVNCIDAGRSTDNSGSENGFDHNPDITAVFWATGATPSTILLNTFRGATSLKYVEIPDSILTIGTSAFDGVRALEMYDFSSTKLTSLGSGAFNHAFHSTTEQTIYLPETITTLFGLSLAHNDTNDSKIKTVQFGSQGHPSQLAQIGSNRNDFISNSSGPTYYNIVAYVSDVTSTFWTDTVANACAGQISLVQA